MFKEMSTKYVESKEDASQNTPNSTGERSLKLHIHESDNSRF